MSSGMVFWLKRKFRWKPFEIRTSTDNYLLEFIFTCSSQSVRIFNKIVLLIIRKLRFELSDGKKFGSKIKNFGFFWVEISYAYVTATKATTKTNKIVVFIFNTVVCSLLELDNSINEHETTAYWLLYFVLLVFCPRYYHHLNTSIKMIIAVNEECVLVL